MRHEAKTDSCQVFGELREFHDAMEQRTEGVSEDIEAELSFLSWLDCRLVFILLFEFSSSLIRTLNEDPSQSYVSIHSTD